MEKSLKGKKVAILATDGFEQSELTEPLKALEEAGATAHIVSPKAGVIKGWKHTEWGDSFAVDATLDDADPPHHYDALLLPGGVMNPDKLRRDPKVQQFVRSFFEEGKPVGAICHGPWTLIDAGVVKGRKVTSYETITDRPEERGRELGRSGGRGGQRPRDQPQAGRPSRVQPEADRGDRGRAARRPGPWRAAATSTK
jgi:protease I